MISMSRRCSCWTMSSFYFRKEMSISGFLDDLERIIKLSPYHCQMPKVNQFKHLIPDIGEAVIVAAFLIINE
jgi:hypothetical protein